MYIIVRYIPIPVPEHSLDGDFPTKSGSQRQFHVGAAAHTDQDNDTARLGALNINMVD